MPVITATEPVPDDGGGIRITATDPLFNLTLTKGQLPQSIQNGTAQQIEDFCNNFLTNKMNTDKYPFKAQIHVLIATPLLATMIVVNLDQTIPPNWFNLPL